MGSHAYKSLFLALCFWTLSIIGTSTVPTDLKLSKNLYHENLRGSNDLNDREGPLDSNEKRHLTIPRKLQATCVDKPDITCKDITVDVTETIGVTHVVESYDAKCDGDLTFDLKKADFTCKDVEKGYVHVEVKVSEVGGKSNKCKAKVTVTDTGPSCGCIEVPDITCKAYTADVTETIDETHVVESYAAKCGGDLTFDLKKADFTCKDVGKDVEVEVKVSEVGGKSNKCKAEVTVTDNGFSCGCDEDPKIECKSDPISINVDGKIVVDAVKASDQAVCGGTLTFKLSQTEFDCDDFRDENIKVKLTATESTSGRSAECERTFEITDDNGDCDCKEEPLLSCEADFDIDIKSGKTVSINAHDIDDGSQAKCGGKLTLSIDRTEEFKCDDIGKSFKITLTVTEEDGLEATCDTDVTVTDKNNYCCEKDPEAICKDVTIKIDKKTKAKLSYWDINDGSKSGCGRKLKYSIDEDEFNCDDLPDDEDSKTFPVILTVEEEDGGTDTCTSNVKVWDEKDYCCDEDPEAKCKEDFEVPVNIEYRRRDRVEAKELDDGSESNCDRDGYLTYSVSDDIDGKYKKHYYFYCDDVDKNITLWLKVKERYWYGQYYYGKKHRYLEDTCDTKVQVKDTEKFCCTDKPDAKCMDKLDIDLDVNGTASIDYSHVNNGSEAKCDGSLTYKIDKSEFNCYDVLIPPLVTLTVTEDRFDRSNTCGVTATVNDTEDACLDNLPPIAIDFPENKLVELCWCDKLEAYIQFYSPEYNQTTNVTVKSDATGWLNIDNDSNFTHRIANITLSGSPGKYSKYGKTYYDVTFIATDDHDPPASTERNLHIHVNKCRGKYKMKKKGKGKYCGKKKI